MWLYIYLYIIIRVIEMYVYVNIIAYHSRINININKFTKFTSIKFDGKYEMEICTKVYGIYFPRLTIFLV